MINDIVGLWVAPVDSFPTTIHQYEESSKFLMNPIFSFTSDSFNIRTEDYRKAGGITVVKGPTELVILETEPYYPENKILIVSHHTQNSLKLWLKSNTGMWNFYKLEKIKEVQ